MVMIMGNGHGHGDDGDNDHNDDDGDNDNDIDDDEDDGDGLGWWCITLGIDCYASMDIQELERTHHDDFHDEHCNYDKNANIFEHMSK